MWECPGCGRWFKNKNQPHSCGQFSIENLLDRFPSGIRELFSLIHNQVEKFDAVQVNPVKNGVMYAVKSTFLALKPRAGYLIVEFVAWEKHDEFPVEKCVRISKSEYAHIIRVGTPEDIDMQLLSWIEEAYLCNCAKSS